MAIVGFSENHPVHFNDGEWVSTSVGESTSGETRVLRHVSGEIEMQQGQFVFALTVSGAVFRVTHSGDLGGKSFYLIDSPAYLVVGPNTAPLVQMSRNSASGTAGGMIHLSGEVIEP